MAGQLLVVRGAGELGGMRDCGGNGSIHQSISNEGKNWSKSSRWKSCSAWGGLSALSVSKISGCWCCFEQQRPNRWITTITLYQWYSSIYNIYCIFGVYSVSLKLSWSTHIPLSLNISYITRGRFRRAWRIMAVCPSPPPSFNHPQLPAQDSKSYTSPTLPARQLCCVLLCTGTTCTPLLTWKEASLNCYTLNS